MLNDAQERLCATSRWDFQDLSAIFLNCTLKRSPELSHTEGLIGISRAIMEKNGVRVEVLRPVDFDIAPGVYPDMHEHGWDRDEWPPILEKVLAAVGVRLTQNANTVDIDAVELTVHSTS